MKQEKAGDAARGILLLPCPAKGTKGTQEHLPWDLANLLLPLSRELQLRQKNADEVMNLPFS